MRKYAFEVIYDVIKNGAYSNIKLNDVFEDNDLEIQDRKFLTNLVYGTLQNWWYLQYQFKDKMSKENLRLEILLSLGTYEILYMSTPDYAVLNEYVDLGKRWGLDKVINAILRNFKEKPIVAEDDLERVALETSHPLWLVNMMSKHYGKEVALAFCTNNNLAPDNIARINRLKTNMDDMIAAGFERIEGYPDALKFDGNISKTDMFRDGLVTIQEKESQMAAILLDPQEGETILDMCAAPGSKTTHLAQIMGNKGKIYAIDLHQHKMKLIANAAKRLGISIIEEKCYDSIEIDTLLGAESMDRVLLDAPCSGFGVFRRKPDMKISKINDDLDELLNIQKDLLDAAYRVTKKGGTIVYSTCTLNKKENEKQIEWFTKEYDDITVEVNEVYTPDKGSDGFYICKMKKA